jgi:hypothetical protein
VAELIFGRRARFITATRIHRVAFAFFSTPHHKEFPIMKDITAFEHMTGRNGFLNHQLGKSWSGCFTGFSWKALRAFVELVDAWYSADNAHRPHVERAMASLVQVFQQSELQAVRMTIYGCGYEGAMLELWPRIDLAKRYTTTPRASEVL